MVHRTVFVLAALCALAFGPACGATSDEQETALTLTPGALASSGPYAVGVTTMELVDTSRSTAPNGDFPGADERNLVTEVWYPAPSDGEEDEAVDAPVLTRDTPYPLIVFAHGLSSFRRQSASYTRHLASLGYVVASPDFPLSGGGAPGGPRIADVENQTADVSFLIDSMLAFDLEEGNRFEGAIDEERIGLTGHSLGTWTTYLALYGEAPDERIDAAVPISIPGCFLDEPAHVDGPPVLFIIGRDDLITAAAGSHRVYELVAGPKYHVEFAGADHIRFADFDIQDRQILGQVRDLISGAAGDSLPPDTDIEGCAPPDELGEPVSGDRQREMLRMFATLFFAAYLRDDEAALRYLQDEVPQQVPEATLLFEEE